MTDNVPPPTPEEAAQDPRITADDPPQVPSEDPAADEQAAGPRPLEDTPGALNPADLSPAPVEPFDEDNELEEVTEVSSTDPR